MINNWIKDDDFNNDHVCVYHVLYWYTQKVSKRPFMYLYWCILHPGVFEGHLELLSVSSGAFVNFIQW